MRIFARGRYTVRFSRDAVDIEAAQRFRHAAFIGGRDGAALTGDRAEGLDRDAFDTLCTHVLIEDARTGALVCCFRMLPAAAC
ncbi:MAG: GNAT family N-acyltransferase, partial [Pseudomonadota bacterium]